MTDSIHERAFESLRSIRVRDIHPSVKLKEAILAKSDAYRNGQFHDAECERLARLFAGLVEDVLSRGYGDLSLRAFIHACAALDYLLNPFDELADHGPRGLEDDAKKLRDAYECFRSEFEAYEKWVERLKSDSRAF